VTGSVAATKTLPLIGALRASGCDVTVLLTPAAEKYKWVSAAEAEAASGHKVLADFADASPLKENSSPAHAILVAPASADFISQLAFASSERAREILAARERGSLLMIAPAMNTKMWEHPAVRRNCGALKKKGVVFLGPVKGHLACDVEGFGRMIGVEEIAEGADAAFAGKQHPALALYKAARREGRKKISFSPPESGARILVALGGENVSWDAVEKLAAEIDKSGADAEYILDSSWAERCDALKKLTGQTVVSDYFQLPELKGLEHIKLPERANGVFIPFLDDTLAEKMVQGRADTLFLAAYLASKAPVITTKECLQTLSPSRALQLRQDGMCVIDDASQLART